MQIEEINTHVLIPYSNNPRNNESAVDAVAASIEEFGFKVPIIIDKDNVIVAGHTRLKAALKIGLEKVPCIKADDLTPEQLKAFRLADNKVGELATWDFNKLEEELAELDMDMSAFGFTQEDDENDAERKDLSGNVDEMYQVIIDCEDESQQAEIFEQLKEEGYKCHVLTL
jgi:ParB-like chromosome segregation protein Spo0J